MPLYRDFSTQEEIDAHYNVLGNVSDPDAIIRGWVERGEAAVAQLDCRLQVPYGPTLAEHCDVFPAGPGAPLHLFIHGGYWRRFSARDHVFVAAGPGRGRTRDLRRQLRAVPHRHDRRDRTAGRAAIAWAFRHGPSSVPTPPV